MSLLQFILAPDTNSAAVTNDVWGRCAAARALAPRSCKSRGRVLDHAEAESRLDHLRQLGWSTVSAATSEQDSAA